jgi:selenide,water dikinase
MGADPLTALQLVGWPRDTIPFELLSRVIEGGLDIMSEARCTVLGGHSVDDPEPKYGFAVTGIAPPEDITTNSAALAGQVLVLTKPLGTGIVSTAAKHGTAPEGVIREAIKSMTELNRGAAAAARRVGARAVTDVTGFGLLGHLSEMTRGSHVSAEIDASSVPILDGVRALVADGEIAGGTRRNLTAIESLVTFKDIPDDLRWILVDAQTSGGLLIAIDAALSDALLQALDDENGSGSVIGRIIERAFEHGPSGRILIS